MSPTAHLVNQTKDLPLLQARLKGQSKRQRPAVSETVRRYGPQIESLRDKGLTHEQIGTVLDISPSSASSLLSRYRTGIREGEIV